MLAVASLHLVTLEATETTGGSSLGDFLPKNIEFQLLVRGRWWAVTLSLCSGGVLRILQQVVDPGRRCGILLFRGAFLQLVHLEPLVPPPQMSQVLIGFFLLQEVDLHKQVQPDIVK